MADVTSLIGDFVTGRGPGERMRATKNAIGLLLALALSGCALAGWNGNTPPETYDLVAADIAKVKRRPAPVQVVVHSPRAVRALDTDRILVKPSSGRITYFSGAVWSDRLPKLVRSRLIQALEDSGHFKAVGTEEDRVSGDYAVLTTLRAFQIEVNGKPTAHIQLFTQIMNDRTGTVLATREFDAAVPAASDSAENSVAALTEAFHRIARDMVDWLSQADQRAKMRIGSRS